MRLGQIRFENHINAAVFEGDKTRPIPGYSLVELIRKAEAESVPLAALASQMAMRHWEQGAPAIPINPVEVWSAAPGPTQCEVFFKGPARICVGPGQPVGVRFDSSFTTPGPALGLVLGRRGEVLGCTLANDLWARDVAQDSRARIYRGSCALGPLIVTMDELAGAGAIEIECIVEREGRPHFSGGARLTPPFDRGAIECLLRANPVPAGSVFVVAADVEMIQEAALAPGDTVVIRSPQIGELANPAAAVQ